MHTAGGERRMMPRLIGAALPDLMLLLAALGNMSVRAAWPKEHHKDH